MSIKLRLPKYPKFEEHQWTDYFELVCLASKDNLSSFGDMVDRLMPISEEVDFEGAISEDTFTEDFEGLEEDLKKIKGKKVKIEKFVNKVIENFRYRIKAFGDDYPFSIDGKSLVVKEKLGLNNRLYIYLLMCSSLGYFGDVQSELTSDFEIVSLIALRAVLSDKFRVEIFGKNSKHPSPYTGKEYDRIKKLCDDLNEKIQLDESQYSNTSTGDGGIDIVAFLELPDKLRGRIIFFAQCKCSPKWKDSIYSSSYSKWHNTIPMMNPSSNIALIPYCMRRPSGGWHSEQDISSVMLIDRQRLLDILNDRLDSFKDLASCEHISKFLEFKEELV